MEGTYKKTKGKREEQTRWPVWLTGVCAYQRWASSIDHGVLENPRGQNFSFIRGAVISDFCANAGCSFEFSLTVRRGDMLVGMVG